MGHSIAALRSVAGWSHLVKQEKQQHDAVPGGLQ
jgi:hypothetical protein